MAREPGFAEADYCNVTECIETAFCDGLCRAHFKQRQRGRVRVSVARRQSSWATVEAGIFGLLALPPESTADQEFDRAFATLRKAIERHGLSLARAKICRHCRRRPRWATRSSR